MKNSLRAIPYLPDHYAYVAASALLCRALRYHSPMTSGKNLWSRWMRVAQKAAEIQGHALFFLLYFLAIVPMGLLNPGSRKTLARRRPGAAPEWHRREPHSSDLASSQRQY
jgi:hypothetical protein